MTRRREGRRERSQNMKEGRRAVRGCDDLRKHEKGDGGGGRNTKKKSLGGVTRKRNESLKGEEAREGRRNGRKHA